MNDTSPEALGDFLRSRAKYAKNTSERLGQVSRVDATCWYLSRVNHASSREVKRFITAFKGGLQEYSRYDRKTKTHGVVKDVERAYAMLNTAYGGVGMDFQGTLRVCLSGPHYGPRAPLYRPLPRTYAATVAGLERAARVERYLSAAA